PPPYHAPDPFVPFGVAVVELLEGLKVVGQISSGTNLEGLKIGADMELIVEHLYYDDEGNDVLAWKFRLV
ncbi:benzoylsuccinyl-CoA thiolase, partial [Chloroflexota bacterium]